MRKAMQEVQAGSVLGERGQDTFSSKIDHQVRLSYEEAVLTHAK